MKSEKSHSQSNRPSSYKPEFNGSVEIIPASHTFIEFISHRRLWGIPFRQLEFLSLCNNPDSDGRKTSPTDMLGLVFKSRIALLFGWRLELLLDPLMQGRVKRIHAEKYLGTLIINEPWVSEIVMVPRPENMAF
jgi:hypothetical protein